MIYALLLLASLAKAQEVSTGTANLLDEVRISNLGKDTRDLLGGRYRQTGKPTFANGFCFADGTCQTTAPSGSVYASSGTIITPGTITQTTFKVAQATVTLAVSGNYDVECELQGGIATGATASSVMWTVYVSSAYLTSRGLSATVAARSCGYNAGGPNLSCGGTYTIPKANLTPGATPFAVILADGSNNAITYPASAYQGLSTLLYWWCREVP